jgi:hypothetical protein
MSSRHASRLFILPSMSSGGARVAVLPLPAMNNDYCEGRTAPDDVRVRAMLLVSDGRVAHSQATRSCRVGR